MKTVIVLLVLIVLCSVHCSVQVIHQTDHPVAGAINGMLEEYFKPRESKVDLFYYGVRGGYSESIVEEIMRTKASGVSVKVMHVQPENYRTIQTNLASIHVFDSVEVFGKCQLHINFTSNPIRRYEQVIHIRDMFSNQFTNQSIISISSVNINFLLLQSPNSDSIELVSMHQLKPHPNCYMAQSTTINRYIGRTQQHWINSTFFPKHFRNFHGCPLSYQEELPKMHKMLSRIFDTLAQHLNFTPHPVEKNSGKKIDVPLRYYEINPFLRTHFSSSVVVEDDDLVFLIPPGEPYSQFEKMFLMFQSEVWIAIGTTFAITLTIIQIVNRLSAKVQNFVYGQNIRSPTLNFVDIFLNGGQNQVPQRNFARFILMLFIIWSLVIRTCYQSTLYALLQTDLRKPRCETIDQLVENNFTLYTTSHVMEKLLDQELIDKFEKNKVTDEATDKVLSDPSTKFAYVGNRNLANNYKKELQRRGVESQYFVLVERIRSMHLSVLMLKFSPYYERLNELIDRMVQSGLIVHWNDVFYGKEPPKKDEAPEPQVLTMKHIGIGFLITSVLLGLSLVVFMIELIYHGLNTVIRSQNIVKVVSTCGPILK